MNALLRKALLLGIVAAVLLLLVEAVLWIAMPVGRYPVYHYTFHNNVSRFNLKEKSEFIVDQSGLRRYEGTAEDRPKTSRLLVLGGPIVYQPLQSAEGTWWGRLAQQLEAEHPDTKVEVIAKASNTSVSINGLGLPLREGVAWAKENLSDQKPDIVLAVYGSSEVLDVPGNYTYEPGRIRSLKGSSSRLKDLILKYSQIARRYRDARVQGAEHVDERRKIVEAPDYVLNMAVTQKKIYDTLEFDSHPPARTGNRDPLPEYLEGLTVLKDLSLAAGARFVVLGEPTFHDDTAGDVELARFRRPRWEKFPSGVAGQTGVGLRPDPAWVESELNRYYEATAAWAAKNTVPFKSLNDEVTLPKSVEQFMDDSTLTDVGSETMASAVTPLVSALLP